MACEGAGCLLGLFVHEVKLIAMQKIELGGDRTGQWSWIEHHPLKCANLHPLYSTMSLIFHFLQVHMSGREWHEQLPHLQAVIECNSAVFAWFSSVFAN
jgi:hypothetical protein